MPPIADDEKPFDLPDGWEWCRLADIACFENGDRSSKYPSGSDLVGKGVPFFGAPDIEDGFLAFGSDLRFITKEKFESLNSGKLRHEDIVVLLRGSVGKTAMFLKSDEYNTGFINAQMLIIRAINSNIVSFKKVFFDSAAYWKQVADEKSGAVIQQMPASAIAKMLFPLPPLPEQERIVTKVEELIALCDALKSKLKMVQKVQLDISEAFVKQAS
ncbi:hypothetical protein C6Y39_02635 [Alteromonas gracilis]|uniref:Type I restriction modification DNA specificity domain-containing protein n=1 Tax=Alteromonas gracilis TaxID=1479524 RepID=A0ABX5CW57_9ALTE|nr:hypothetical protein C6Y39_02635 [Alteromonas gracilis]